VFRSCAPIVNQLKLARDSDDRKGEIMPSSHRSSSFWPTFLWRNCEVKARIVITFNQSPPPFLFFIFLVKPNGRECNLSTCSRHLRQVVCRNGKHSLTLLASSEIAENQQAKKHSSLLLTVAISTISITKTFL
jgi:hypothetical protein